MTKPKEIILEQMPVGPMDNFIYFLGDVKTKEIAVIDPAWDVDYLRQEAQKQNYKIIMILLTHGHADHVNGIKDLQSTHDVPVYISEHEIAMFTPKCKNLKKVKPGEKIKIGNVEIECLHMPGHSPGCQGFLTHDQLIAGDAVFVDGCGRCDLPGSNVKAMYNSLYNVVMKLPDSTIIYPGHNYGPVPFATLGEQKKTNPYLQAKSMEDFLIGRMGF